MHILCDLDDTEDEYHFVLQCKNGVKTLDITAFHFEVDGYTAIVFHFYSDRFCSLERCKQSKMGSTLKGKNLHIEEKILSFKK